MNAKSAVHGREEWELPMNKALLATIGLVLVAGVAVVWWKQPSSEVDLKTPTVNAQMHGADDAAPARPEDQIVLPQFSSAAQMGKIAFDANCSACHGENAAGSDNGPPLIHTLYRTDHHADFAFQRAAMAGVQAHHWRFGNMLPVEGVTQKQVEWIVQYVREIQRANGIN
jgi:mono/diheme cytochrome c family protein